MSTRKSESWYCELAALTWSEVTGRTVSAPIEATGRPTWSARSTQTVSADVAVSRTRSAVAPTASRHTRSKEYGRTLRPAVASLNASVCSAASSSAGCRPKCAASARAASGSATSANTSPPRRHTARRPWKVGP